MALNTYADVQAFITNVLTTNGDIGKVKHAPHTNFWSTLSYNDFVNGVVPGVVDLNTGAPIPILVKGDSSKSNIILSLTGTGPYFDKDPLSNSQFGQMPAGNSTVFTAAQIQQLADWIDAGCPQ